MVHTERTCRNLRDNNSVDLVSCGGNEGARLDPPFSRFSLKMRLFLATILLGLGHLPLSGKLEILFKSNFLHEGRDNPVSPYKLAKPAR